MFWWLECFVGRLLLTSPQVRVPLSAHSAAHWDDSGRMLRPHAQRLYQTNTTGDAGKCYSSSLLVTFHH